MKYLNRNVKTIFLILGKGCNFNCRYCMQSETQKSGIVYPTEINEDIYEFIEEIALNQEEPFYVHFYGGEPLLYKDKLKIITERLCGIKNIYFSVITNGSLINEELVDFFNTYNFSVNISWDGRFSLETRKRDVFKENKENLFNINDLGVNAVISSVTPLNVLIDDIQKLFNEYRNKTGHFLRVNYDEIYDATVIDKSLLDVDYKKYSEISRSIVKECISIKIGKVDVSLETFRKNFWAKMAFFQRVYPNIKQYVLDNEKCIKYMAPCCNGIEIINLDLEGNLYSCHNCDIRVGSIYSDFKNYLDKLFKNDNTKYYFEKYCSDCKVYPICRGGCKLVSEDARNKSYCKLKRAILLPAIEEILNIVNYE